MKKIGIVVQRYGNDVVGGAETLARNIAERLNASGFDVTVFTTTARDYVTWSNIYPSGESILKGVVIKRYRVKKERNIDRFNRYSRDFFSDLTGRRDEDRWITEQGPVVPELIDALKKEQQEYDIFIFFTYLYFTTVRGMQVIKKPVILFPTAHDEPPIFLELMKGVFQRPDALLFLSAAEMEFVRNQFNPKNDMQLVRSGIDIHPPAPKDRFREKFMVVAPYLLYAGRVEKGKGLETVFNAFEVIRKKRLIDLVLIGKQLMDIPRTSGVRYLGYISESEKLSAFRHAILSVQPSALESLSITTLESFSQKTPVLVNRKSAVLGEHVNLSGGGLSYVDEQEFIDCFLRIYDSPVLRDRLGEKGYQYLKKYYSWEVVMKKIRQGIDRLLP
jgi:glycosyltransferase involved in cell wall biosynthesis